MAYIWLNVANEEAGYIMEVFTCMGSNSHLRGPSALTYWPMEDLAVILWCFANIIFKYVFRTVHKPSYFRKMFRVMFYVCYWRKVNADLNDFFVSSGQATDHCLNRYCHMKMYSVTRSQWDHQSPGSYGKLLNILCAIRAMRYSGVFHKFISVFWSLYASVDFAISSIISPRK